jgi:hypothetical protein
MSLMSLLLAVLGTIGAIVLIVGIALGSVLWRALGKVIGNELEVAIPELAQGLLEKAIARSPEEHRPRLEEEWTAGLKDSLEKRPLWALAQAASLYLKAGRIAAELKPAPVPVRPGRIFEEVRKVASQAETIYLTLVYGKEPTGPMWLQRLIKVWAVVMASIMVAFLAFGTAYLVLYLLNV